MNSEQDGSESIHSGTSEEDLFYQKIEETFGCTIVRPMYLPEMTQFLVGEIDESMGKINTLYECENKIIHYQLIVNYRSQSYGYDVEDNLVDESIKEVFGVPITMKTYELPDGECQYVAQFEYDNIFYILNAAVPEDEFEKILENLYFY